MILCSATRPVPIPVPGAERRLHASLLAAPAALGAPQPTAPRGLCWSVTRATSLAGLSPPLRGQQLGPGTVPQLSGVAGTDGQWVVGAGGQKPAVTSSETPSASPRDSTMGTTRLRIPRVAFSLRKTPWNASFLQKFFFSCLKKTQSEPEPGVVVGQRGAQHLRRRLLRWRRARVLAAGWVGAWASNTPPRTWLINFSQGNLAVL